LCCAVAALAVSAGVAVAAPAAAIDPRAVTLRLDDVPTGFAVTRQRYVPVAEVAKVADKTVAQVRALGFLRSYQREFERQGTAQQLTTGPVAIRSTTSVFRSAKGATAARRLPFTVPAPAKMRLVSLRERIGDQATLRLITLVEDDTPVAVFVLSWQSGSVVGQILVSGLQGAVAAGDAVRLARAQQARIARA
jgi:hypothetical protein